MQKNKIYIETYGCQMNLADTEIVLGILNSKGYGVTQDVNDADVVLLNTCSIRENAEQRIYGRLGRFKNIKESKPDLVVGILGCMAERLRKDLVEKKSVVDLVVGPDEYRRLPELIDIAYNGDKGIGVKLSRTETYDDIAPHREDGLQAWISVMRGCDKFCTFCVVPFTRGRERSRTLTSIVDEIKELSNRGFKEVTLLGQNVNSYLDDNKDFADLLAACAEIDRSMRIRFTTSHPQDLSDRPAMHGPACGPAWRGKSSAYDSIDQAESDPDGIGNETRIPSQSCQRPSLQSTASRRWDTAHQTGLRNCAGQG